MWLSPTTPWFIHFYLAWLALLCTTTLAVAEPLLFNAERGAAIQARTDTPTLQPRDNSTFLLRIMPLGASITLGYRSTDLNGYRRPLRQQLRYAGWQVDMIGSKRNGTMRNNHHEGHFGHRVDQLWDEIQETISLQPNLILINAGTNDAVQNHQIPTTGTRMNTLLSHLYTSCPNTTIILSTLLANKKHSANVDAINTQYRDIVAQRRAQNDRIVLADMSSFIKLDQLVDGTHPDNAGYEGMAAVWWAAVRDAEKEGFLEIASGTGEGGWIGRSVEEALDDADSTVDPKLPAYTAPAEPGGSSSSSSSSGSAGSGISAVKAGVKSGGMALGRDGRRRIGAVALQVFSVGLGLFALHW